MQSRVLEFLRFPNFDLFRGERHGECSTASPHPHHTTPPLLGSHDAHLQSSYTGSEAPQGEKGVEVIVRGGGRQEKCADAVQRLQLHHFTLRQILHRIISQCRIAAEE